MIVPRYKLLLLSECNRKADDADFYKDCKKYFPFDKDKE